ncbi:hypothetical protein IK1_06024, partial [Bacillus cereus VD146]
MITFNPLEDNDFGIDFKESYNQFGESVTNELDGFYTKVNNNKGLTVNSGVNYPFKLVTRDGVSSNPIVDINNAILDVKVINAKPGKWYKIDWIGNGYTGWGTPNYSMFIGEYDEKTFTNPRTIFDRVSHSFPAPTQNIEYKLFTKINEDVMVSVTVDYSKLKKDRYPMN